jgi:nitrate/nitrite transport system permease protein
MSKFRIENLVLPLVGLLLALGAWGIVSALTRDPATGKADLPSPLQTWDGSKEYILKPFEKRGELDQGIGAFTLLSLGLVLRGYAISLIVAVPLGFMLGSSKLFSRMFDPIIQILRPVSPLAWLPLGYLVFFAVKRKYPDLDVPEWAALFTIAICAMWPTVLNTAVGVRSIPQDYLNVAKVLQLSRSRTLFKILLPATLPYMFTGFRLSLGIAWLVIVAAEMLTGRPGVGGFLWQEYNAGISEHIILSILTIGIVGFLLDRLMSVVEANVHHILNLPGYFRRMAERLRSSRDARRLADAAA